MPLTFSVLTILTADHAESCRRKLAWHGPNAILPEPAWVTGAMVAASEVLEDHLEELEFDATGAHKVTADGVRACVEIFLEGEKGPNRPQTGPNRAVCRA